MQGYMRRVFIFSAIGIVACAAAAAAGVKSGKEMVEAASGLVAKGVTVIDVRDEACQGYVKGAHRISVDDITAKSPEALKKISEATKNNKSAPIAVYCRAGGRAGRAMKALQEAGYTNVENLGGVDTYYDEKLMEKCSQ